MNIGDFGDSPRTAAEYMQAALTAAKKSGEAKGGAVSEVPVGCVIVQNGKIIASSHNQKEALNDVTAHAEILALKEATYVSMVAHSGSNAGAQASWRLEGCKMFVTLEPCPMCMWAILNARVDELYFGAYDYNYGAAGSKLDLAPLLNSKIKITGGILEAECEELLKNYFAELRGEK